jgi:uncharacterized cupin superfamily protein
MNLNIVGDSGRKQVRDGETVGAPACARSGTMNGNMNNRDLEYYQRRERQERERAERADDTTARRVHLELAERYSTLLRSPAILSVVQA